MSPVPARQAERVCTAAVGRKTWGSAVVVSLKN